MNDVFRFFWAALIFSSIAWYAFLAFYVGIKAGREISVLIKSLKERSATKPPC